MESSTTRRGFLQAFQDYAVTSNHTYVPTEILCAVYGATEVTRPKKTEDQGIWARCKQALVRLYYRFTVNCPKER